MEVRLNTRVFCVGRVKKFNPQPCKCSSPNFTFPTPTPSLVIH